jgi:5-hydroxyisourate hydrolase
MAITTHVLDVARGRPAAGVAVTLEIAEGTTWGRVGQGVTDADGRARDLLPAGTPLQRGTYRLRFATGDYHAPDGGFYPQVTVEFAVRDPAEHHHVPLLLSPFGYSTYRGS